MGGVGEEEVREKKPVETAQKEEKRKSWKDTYTLTASCA